MMESSSDLKCNEMPFLPTDGLNKEVNTVFTVKRRDVSDFVNPFLQLAMCGRMNAVDDSETPYDSRKYDSVSGGPIRRGISNSFPLLLHVDVDTDCEQNENKTPAQARPFCFRVAKNTESFSFRRVSYGPGLEMEEDDSDDESIGLNELHLPESS